MSKAAEAVDLDDDAVAARAAEDGAAVAAAEELDPRFLALLPSNDPRRIAFEAAVAKELAERDGEAAAEPEVEPRAALRAAITKHNAAADRLAELTKAVPKAEDAIVAARSAVEAATEAVEKAKTANAAHASAKALGTAGTALPPPMRSVRLRLADAEDVLEVAKAACTELQEEHAAATEALSYARSDVDDAVAAVIRSDPAIKTLFETFEQERRCLAERRRIVELVLDVGNFSQQARLSLLSEGIDEVPSAKCLEWEGAMMALREDADAALPV
jgi:hypothetical protein